MNDARGDAPHDVQAQLVAEYLEPFREWEKATRERRARVRDVMPPRWWAPKAAVDMAGVALAGREVIEARQALEDAKTALGRIALDAYFQGCPATMIAQSAGVSATAVSRYSWRAYAEMTSDRSGG